MIKIIFDNEVYLQVISNDYGLKSKISDHFSFRMKNAQFHPKVKLGVWDGYLRLFNMYNGLLYRGLFDELADFLNYNKVPFEIEGDAPENISLSKDEISSFINKLNLPFEPRYYQIEGFKQAVENKRQILLSPTNSGKSLIMYLIIRYLLDNDICQNKKFLIIVPSIQLVQQLFKDFENYGFVSESFIHTISEGASKVVPEEKKIVIATYQSIYKLGSKFFSQFFCVLGDEVHKFRAASLNSIMEKLEQTEYRIGLSGTLQESYSDKLALTGLFGNINQLITNEDMIQKGWSADILIKALVLKYSDEERKAVTLKSNKADKKTAKKRYDDEIDYIIHHPKRANFIKNLALSLKGNTLILYRFVEKHGKPTFKELKKDHPNVHFISGSICSDEREEIRGHLNKEKNAIVIASIATFGTGINATFINNIILITPVKSSISVLQLIGRGLRKGNNKNKFVLYDIVDDFSWKKKKNYSLQHFLKRIDYYNNENFKFKLINIKIKNGD